MTISAYPQTNWQDIIEANDADSSNGAALYDDDAVIEGRPAVIHCQDVAVYENKVRGFPRLRSGVAACDQRQ